MVKIAETNPDFESCDNCIHSDDSEIICIVRGCVHAVSKLHECYLPKQPERKKGKWIHDGYDFPHGNDWIHCSECGKRGINVPADLTNFCPNCGADMREGEQE